MPDVAVVKFQAGKKKKKDKHNTDENGFKAYDEKRSALMQNIKIKRISYCVAFSNRCVPYFLHVCDEM